MTDAPVFTTKQIWRHHGVRPLLILNLVVSTATMLQVTALGAFVFDITGNPFDLGLLGLAEFLPSALLVLVTGSVADRVDRRVVAIGAITAETITAAGLFLYARTGPTSVGPIFAIIFCFGIARAFAAPATRSMPVMVAPPGGLSRLVGMNSMTWQAATIVGPAAGGLLFDVGPTTAFAVAVGMFGSGAVLAGRLASLPPRREVRQEPPSLKSALEGLTVVRTRPILLGAISLDLFAVLFGGAMALIPAIATERLHVGAAGQGWLRASAGVGAACSAVVLIGRPLSRRVGRKLFVAVAVFGLGTIVFGLTHSFVVALVAVFALSASDMVSVSVRSTLVPLATPDSTRGRVMAVENVFIGASNELGAFESGTAASAIGTAGAVVSGGVATLVVVALWWKLFPALRDVDRYNDIVATPEPRPPRGERAAGDSADLPAEADVAPDEMHP